MNKMTQNIPSSSTSGASPQPTITEYSIRVPKASNKTRHHIMRFNYNLNVDFSQWRSVKMERENNMREFKMTEDDEIPKFGAGSEYNRDQKEEARRKKFGIIAKKYNPDNQPWILKVGSGHKTSSGKKDMTTGKKFRGIREGGVSENAAHFVFTQTKDGSIEAFPLNEWYNFQPIQRYKALTAEEAEEEFGRRRKCVNMWTMKMRMKLKNKDDVDEAEMDPEDTKAAKSSKGGDKKKLQISEMDEWMDSDDMSSTDEEEGEEKKKKEDEDSDNDAKSKQKKAKGKALNLKKKKKRDVDDEAFEDSDDGDEEGREKDYISDTSDSESEPETKVNKELKSVAEEDALRKLLTSDEDSDEEKSNKDENESEEERKKKPEESLPKESEPKPEKTKEKKKDDKKTKMQKFYDAINQGPGTGNASDFSSDSDESGSEKPTKKKKKAEKPVDKSRSGTPIDSAVALKRKAEIVNISDNSNSPKSTPAKKMKAESAPSVPATSFSSFSSAKDSFGSTEDAVRRYLMRKPMTTTELLKKIQSKKTGVSSDELVEMMTAILKKINPAKQRIQGKMYLSLKATG